MSRRGADRTRSGRRKPGLWPFAGGLVPLLGLLLGALPVRAQLISPGELTAAHASLEGIRNCTSCHEIGQRGIAPAKCLNCHTPLRDRIRRNRGFHATVSQQCATCHKDHFGRTFDPIRLSTGSFNHADTGFRLVGRHLNQTCRTCHQPSLITDAAVRRFKGNAGRLSQTFLGLPNDCASCHRTDNPHGASFQGEACDSCHNPASWNDVSSFDHAATGFALVGQHARIECTSCHGSAGRGAARFEGLSTACESCHRDDNPHGAQFRGQTCASCHSSATWNGAPNFNHNRTAFALTGAHVRVSCSSCHPGSGGNRRFDGTPQDCAACHDDAHDGAFGTDCATCHATGAWEQMSRSFAEDRFDHAAQTGFALVGIHGSLDCQSCHAQPARNDGAIRIRLVGASRGETFPAVEHDTCLSCHVDYHDGEFAQTPGGPVCANCHGQTAWTPTSFDLERHAQTAFPLAGAHLVTPCSACHVRPGHDEPEFALATACEGCHADLNPHGSEFADADGVTRCAECHNASDWDLAAFDHRTTGFPLLGAHVGVQCTDCHAREERPDGTVVRRFSGLDQACESCHGADSPHQGQFEGQACADCHDAQAFTIAAFDHTTTRFPLDGAHQTVACGSCHRPELAPNGERFVRFKPLGTACEDCHGS